MFEELSDATFDGRIAEVKAGVCIFYKQLCPHCKNMEKVLEKFSRLQPDVTLLSVDIEQNPVSAGVCGAERAPTIIVIRDGKVAGRKAGLMNPREMAQFFDSCR